MTVVKYYYMKCLFKVGKSTDISSHLCQIGEQKVLLNMLQYSQ